MNILFLTSASPKKAGFSTSEKRPPLGLGYIISILKNKGHNVYFSDEYLEPTNILDSDFLQKNKIDFVGIQSNTICYQSTLEMFRKLQKKREKKLWEGKIMVGGPHTSVGFKEIPEYVDYVVIGEGEITVPKIINGEIKERVIYGEKLKELDDLPMPSWEEFIYRPYIWHHSWIDTYPLYTMSTTRGCPFNCSFCSVKAIWNKTYTCMSAERIVNDIQFMIKRYGARGIYFREDNFTLNKKRCVNFCELLIKKNIKIDWICESRADILNDYEYQKLMADAGCKVLYMGIESGSPKMLEFYKKGETIEQFIKAFDISHKVGIKTYASFVDGFPTETKEDRKLTEKLIQEIKPDYIGRNIYLGLPGSELYDFIKKNNLYEYEDEQHILYPIGFKENVKKYYGDNPYFNVYGTNASEKIPEQYNNKQLEEAYKKLDKIWVESQKAWKTWEETNQRLIDKEKELEEVNIKSHQFWLESQKAWETWEETNQRLIETVKKLEKKETILEETIKKLHSAETDLESVKEKLKLTEKEFQLVLNSQSYRLSLLFRDAYKNKKMLLLFPSRFIYFFYSFFIKKIIET